MTSIEIKLGDRVRLNELGASRSPKIKVRTGVVVAFSGNRSGGASLGILFDGNKRPTTLHRSYVERGGEGQMKLWRWLQNAVAPTGPPVFLVGVIAFLISVLVSIYMRSR
jgi:hypothetical protein